MSEIKPRKVYGYKIEFWRGTGMVFGKGHRIRVEVSTSYFPYYLRNPDGGGDHIALLAESVVAEQMLHHDSARPSHIILPVIPAREAVGK